MTNVAGIVSVTSVEVLDHYKVRVGFSDGVVRDVDLSHLRDGGPIFEPLRDPSYFQRVRVDPDARTIVWPNGADVDPLVLHGDAPPANSQRTA